MRVGRGSARVNATRLSSAARVAATEVQNAVAAGEPRALEAFLKTFVGHLASETSPTAMNTTHWSPGASARVTRSFTPRGGRGQG